MIFFYNLEACSNHQPTPSMYYNYGVVSIFIKVLSVNENDVDPDQLA